MTNVKLKDATKELASEATKVRDEATRVRKEADDLLRLLREQENAFQRERDEEAARVRNEERQKKMSDHSKAYVMLDEDERAQLDAMNVTAEKPAPAQETAPAEPAVPAPAQEAPAAVSAPAPERPAPKAEKPEQFVPKAEKPEQPRKADAAPKPAIGQIIARPGQQVQPQKPVGLAPNVIRPPRPV